MMLTKEALQVVFEHVSIGQSDVANHIIGCYLLGWIAGADGEWKARDGKAIVKDHKTLIHDIHLQSAPNKQYAYFDVVIALGIEGRLPDYIPTFLTPLAQRQLEKVVGFKLNKRISRSSVFQGA